MEFKFSVIFGIVLAIVVQAVANAVFMVGAAYVSAAAIIAGIVMTLILSKFYLGKVSATMTDMLVTSIIWVIIVAISDVAVAFALGSDMMTYFSNYMIYVGYVLIIVVALAGFKLFGAGSGGTEGVSPPKPAQEAPAEETA